MLEPTVQVRRYSSGDRAAAAAAASGVAATVLSPSVVMPVTNSIGMPPPAAHEGLRLGVAPGEPSWQLPWLLPAGSQLQRVEQLGLQASQLPMPNSSTPQPTLESSSLRGLRSSRRVAPEPVAIPGPVPAAVVPVVAAASVAVPVPAAEVPVAAVASSPISSTVAVPVAAASASVTAPVAVPQPEQPLVAPLAEPPVQVIAPQPEVVIDQQEPVAAAEAAAVVIVATGSDAALGIADAVDAVAAVAAEVHVLEDHECVE
jgi:hypothetical protein